MCIIMLLYKPTHDLPVNKPDTKDKWDTLSEDDGLNHWQVIFQTMNTSMLCGLVLSLLIFSF